jgi:hypothetical protein
MRPAHADEGLLRASRVDDVSLAVGDIDKALGFYGTLFGNEVLKDSRTLRPIPAPRAMLDGDRAGCSG